MILIDSSTELTTAATDAVLAIECGIIILWLSSSATADRHRRIIWCWVFGLLAISSFLGALAHGLNISDSARAALWKPLYLSLGILIGLFIVGVVSDWFGGLTARRLVPWGIGIGVVFFAVTELLSGSLAVFIIYETVALSVALAIYIFLATTRREKGAPLLILGITTILAAGGLQVGHISFHFLFDFDHNGAFHLLQMPGIALLAIGLRPV